MCGITGFTFKDQKKLELMNNALTHRGPDYAGMYVSEDISLGHLLLSIRADNTISRQPYKDNPEWVLLFNGQIYNTDKLKSTHLQDIEIDPARKDLDTYIIYKLIEKYGWNFIDKIHGMFAIALYNTQEKKLKLYRDPSGQKGLYYYHKDDIVIFSSEIKALFTHPITREADYEAIEISATIGYTPGDKTIFKNIYKLQPSEVLTYHITEKKLEKTFFKSSTDNYYPENLDDAFKDLIAEHLQSKQKIAINLSGGLDSSLLLHEMSQVGHTIHSYTNRFIVEGDPELSKKYNADAELAAQLAQDYNAIHTEILVTKQDYFNNFIEAYKAIEEPNYNISLPTYLFTAKKEGIYKDGNRVVLSGDGGDELFGGYPHYIESAKIQKKMHMRA